MVAVYARLPRAGLGNRLLVWARAMLFAQLNGLRCHVVGGNPIPIGSWLRGEHRSLRSGFAFSRSPFDGMRVRLSLRNETILEPSLKRHDGLNQNILFCAVPSWKDYFVGLREHRNDVVRLFNDSVSHRTVVSVARQDSPEIAIHLRRGDFRALGQGEDFAKSGGTRTPDEYFVSQIELLRARAGRQVPVTLFSDGTDAECAGLLKMPKVSRAPKLGDLGHMLLMSRAKVILPSAGSTFSMWSGFLSNAAVLYHPAHFHSPTRPPSTNLQAFEGPAPDRDGPFPSSIEAVLANFVRE